MRWGVPRPSGRAGAHLRAAACPCGPPLPPTGERLADLPPGHSHAMRVALVTGIFPPDIGGPATHAADLAAELRRRGHEVTVLTLTDGARSTGAGLVRFPRRWPWPVRLAAVTAWLVRHRRRYEVVYATGLHPAAVAGARLARRPVVVKVVGDPAWERATRLGLESSSFEAFQRAAGPSLRSAAMRALRNQVVRRADAVVTPSEYLRGVVRRWQRGRGPDPCVIPNGVALPPGAPAARAASPAGRLRAVVVGRLVDVKRYDVAIEAVANLQGAELVVVGDGPERGGLEALARTRLTDGRIRFAGPLPHDRVLAELAAADVLVSTSSHEGLPHVVLEALAVGTPVVASAAGGTGEAVVDGLNGRLVEPPTPEAFEKVLAELRDDPSSRARLAAGAAASAERWRFERTAQALEGLLAEVVGGRGRRAPRQPPPRRPRLVNLGKARVDPADPATADKMAIVARFLDATFICGGPAGVRTIQGVRVVGLPTLRPKPLGSAAFYLAAPALALAVAARRPGSAVACQSPFEALGVLALRRLVPRRRRPRVVVELHGDWRTAARLYGHRSRRLAAPLADRAAAWALRRADRVRAVSAFLEGLARRAGYEGEIDRYIAFSEFAEFLADPPAPLPTEPAALFAGVLEPPKAPEVLIEAWGAVAARLPHARLTIAGRGPMEAALRARVASLGIAGSVRFAGHLTRAELRRQMDAATCLVLPSRNEGLGRVVVEAMARGRPVVGTAAGGIPELVDDGATGRLVPMDDPAALAAALVEVLAEPERAAAMGAEGRRRAEALDPTRAFADGVARLAAWVRKGAAG